MSQRIPLPELGPGFVYKTKRGHRHVVCIEAVQERVKASSYLLELAEAGTRFSAADAMASFDPKFLKKSSPYMIKHFRDQMVSTYVELAKTALEKVPKETQRFDDILHDNPGEEYVLWKQWDWYMDYDGATLQLQEGCIKIVLEHTGKHSATAPWGSVQWVGTGWSEYEGAINDHPKLCPYYIGKQADPDKAVCIEAWHNETLANAIRNRKCDCEYMLPDPSCEEHKKLREKIAARPCRRTFPDPNHHMTIYALECEEARAANSVRALEAKAKERQTTLDLALEFVPKPEPASEPTRKAIRRRAAAERRDKRDNAHDRRIKNRLTKLRKCL